MWSCIVCLFSVFWHLSLSSCAAYSENSCSQVLYFDESFDESLNQINQKKQMDMTVRFGTAKAIKLQKDTLIQSL